MSDPRFDLWRKYNSNSQVVDHALTLVSRLAKEALRISDTEALNASTRLATMMLAAYMECRVNEAVWHYAGLSESEKEQLNSLSVENRWRQLVISGFAKRRSLPLRSVPDSLQFTDRARHDLISSIIDNRIVPLVQVRNALAHGNLVYAFTANGMRVDQSRMKEMSKYTLWRVTLERNLLGHLGDVVHDLVVTRHAHERDFDKRIKDLQSAQGRIRNGDRRKWERMIVARHQRRPSI